MCKDCGCSEGNARIYFKKNNEPENNEYTEGVQHIHTHVHTSGQREVHVHLHIHSPEHQFVHSHDHDSHGHSHEHSHGHSHEHSHGHSHEHSHGHDHTLSITAKNHVSHQLKQKNGEGLNDARSRTVVLESKVLEKNDAIAKKNRAWLKKRDVKTVNLISSPGSGKTYLLEKTLERLRGILSCAVITGDQQTDNDAKRLSNKGAPVIQIETKSSCHLDAAQIERHLDTTVGEKSKLLLIENVGNLVCPAAFDLGEDHKIAVLSVAEGEDKPLKYPVLFSDSPVCVITKIDLLSHLDFDIELCKKAIKTIRPDVTIFEVSAKTGEGMDNWINYLTSL